MSAPPVDGRAAADIRTELIARLHAEVPEWVEADASGHADQGGAALIGVFARFCEIFVQRLNQVPDKNFLAYLDLLGVARLPPQPARAPLTFTLAAGSSVDAVVPAGTQAAAPPTEGEKQPVIFETERELTVVAATVQALVAVDAERDLVADHSGLLGQPATVANVYAGDRPNEHILYIGSRAYLAYPRIKTLTLEWGLSGVAGADTRALAWEAWDGSAWATLTPADGTNALRQSGNVSFADLAAVPEQTLYGVTSRWLRVRLLTPVSPGATLAVGMVRAGHLPAVGGLHLRAEIDRTALAPQAAFVNGQALDVSKPWFPFGEKPRLGDALHASHEEAFAQPGAEVTLSFTLLNPLGGAQGSPPPVKASGDLSLRWEVWNGGDWTLLGTATPSGASGAGFTDTTNAFTQSGDVTFTLPANLAATAVNGLASFWLRVQIAKGEYGRDARYTLKTADPADGYVLVPADFAPPVVSAFTIGYGWHAPSLPADDVLAYNNLELESLGATLAAGISVTPFRAFAPAPPLLHVAFGLPPGRRTFPNRTVSLYHAIAPLQYGERNTPLHPDLSIETAAAGSTAVHRFTVTNAGLDAVEYDLAAMGFAWAAVVSSSHVTVAAGESAEITVTVTTPDLADLPGGNGSDRGFLLLRPTGAGMPIRPSTFETRVGQVAARRRDARWEYWNGRVWAALAAVDGTERQTRAGIVEFLAPADIAAASKFGVTGYWVRAALEPGEDPTIPRLHALLPNTVFAAQTVTSRNEVLGSSDVTENQEFGTSRTPILAGQQLEVREPERPSAAELAVLATAHGTAAVTPVADGRDRGNEVWVRWIEVPDFHGSGPYDRHYVLDRFVGAVRFGDGAHGRIPPRGIGNIRMARYQTGGGSSGNRAAGTIVQLKTTVPYVEKVYNAEPASGGFDAEPIQALVARAPRTVRHGMRSVALEDYEDLARLAAPEVARARCVPLHRLDRDALGTSRVPGAVSVIILPAAAAAKPVPSVELLARARDYLCRHASPTADIAVVGPLYVRVDVTVDAALVSLEGASQVEQAIRDGLAAFLHPLSGGRDGTGWDFGRTPHLSDLYAVIGDIAGVDHVRGLSLDEHEEVAGAKATERFLVYSGRHQIRLSYVGAE